MSNTSNNNDIEKLKDIFEKFPNFTVEDFKFCLDIFKERDEYALLLFQPIGDFHHDANKCPYCKDNLNGKTI